MGGSTFTLERKDFQVPKYSQYANNYHVTFHKVNNPSVARAIVKQLALSPPVASLPKDDPPLREITVIDPADQPVALVFQHKIAVLNKHSPGFNDQYNCWYLLLLDCDMSIEQGHGGAPTMEDYDMGDAAVSPPVVLNANEVNAMEGMDTPHQIQLDTAPEVEEQYTSPLEFQPVTGDRFNPAPKRPLSPLSPQVTTSNRNALLQEDDLELSFEGYALPRSKIAHFERATKLIREKDVESNILACTRLLNAEPQVVAHSMYPAEAEFGLLKALASTRTIHRLMASHTETGDSGDYTTYLPFTPKAAKISKSLPVNWRPIQRSPLFVWHWNAPYLYNNLDALDHFCGQRATRWATGDVLMDLSILKVARTLYPILKSMNLPSFIGGTLEFLVETIMDHSTNLDTLCDEATHSMQATAWEDLQVSA
ncbi:hypothetical protein H310_05221 [Aphanomyces invadans]|uniref:Uncharacterized protein n=1 Tax=Aphanomyces invadans TaxID=157072 RepID=A0A024UDD0_9STRA|nr:hypothetical protein H310_05221 [Aphanomyces invadans]ETW03877.1 hypothetical protein H310_05221 [Aphanomyces invadans]|eukprot:XP_008868106.1 hypothetical protein H310_05221 [Aphanomyces invadans]